MTLAQPHARCQVTTLCVKRRINQLHWTDFRDSEYTNTLI